MKKSISFALISFFSLVLLFSQNQNKFEFKHKKNDSVSYISTVQENVYLNEYLHHSAQIINRIASTVSDVTSDGSGIINASYMTTENSFMSGSGRHLSWGEESFSAFTRKTNGELTISDNIFMPTVRNVPVFPEKTLRIGDKWKAEGKEVHDLRSSFNMNRPLIIPFTADYTYLRDENIDGKTLNVIEVEYDFYYENSNKNNPQSTLNASAGYSKQTLWWDNQKGILDHYDEIFQIQIQDIFGNVYEFSGTAEAFVTEFKSVNNEDTVQKLQQTVEKLDIQDVQIKKGEKGLTISIENIQFEPDSAVLKISEKQKLDKIANIISEYSNDILITGHCAARGTEESRQKLSEERAESVADYLESTGVRDRLHIFTQGKSSSEPVASNATEEGRKRNRRVEIILVE